MVVDRLGHEAMSDDTDARARALLESAGIVASDSQEATARAAVDRAHDLLHGPLADELATTFGYAVPRIATDAVRLVTAVYDDDLRSALEDGREADAQAISAAIKHSIALTVLSIIHMMDFEITPKGGLHHG